MHQNSSYMLLQWLLPVVVVSTGLSYVLMCYLPNTRERAELAVRINEGIKAERLSQVVATTLNSDQNRLQILKRDLEKTSRQMVSEELVVEMPSELHRIGQSCGIQIMQLTPMHSTALQSYYQQRYTLRVTGGQSQLLQFLFQIETEYPTVRISQFNSIFTEDPQPTSAQLVLEVLADYTHAPK